MNVGDKDTSAGVFVTSHLRPVFLQLLWKEELKMLEPVPDCEDKTCAVSVG
jgi:hypothetical protein